ncbi:MAG: RNA polymerase sigma factor [Crocinitomicaceae bacterium]
MFSRNDIDYIYQLIKDSLNTFHAKSIKACDRDDLRQDIMMKVMRCSHQFDPEKGSLKNWVSRIITNCIYDLKRKKIILCYSDDMSIFSIYSADQAAIDEEELFMDRMTHMENVLDAESEINRVMFNEFYIDGYSNKEISERHRIPEKKLAMRRNRIKAKVKTTYRNKKNE